MCVCACACAFNDGRIERDGRWREKKGWKLILCLQQVLWLCINVWLYSFFFGLFEGQMTIISLR